MNGRRIAYWLIGIGTFISFVLLLIYLYYTTELNGNSSIDTDIFASFGTLVGGILGALFSLAGIFLLINTLEAQENAIQLQQDNFDRQLFEGKFYDLLKIHRENSNEISIKERSGRKVFLVLHREFQHCKLVMDAFNETWPEKFDENHIINISYLCFFFGAVGELSKEIIIDKLKAYPERRESILNYFEKFQESIPKEDFPYRPFEGHQSRLGHYFRHLYQTVKFVDEQPSEMLSYSEKYGYIKTLRAQLSNPEQALLFYNSLSDLGKPWEMALGLDSNRKLITKYNLIKNIPHGYTTKLDVNKYYPDVNFEGEVKSPSRQRLEASYT